MTRNRGLLALLAAGLLVAGCGGSSGTATAAAPPTTTTTRPSTASNAPQQRAADTALARRAVLALTDFPIGFTSSPHDTSGNNDLPPAVERKFLACVHFPKRFLDNKNDDQPHADSPDFNKGKVGDGPAAQIESSVEIDRSVTDISEPLTRLAAPRAAQCFDPFFRAIFAQSLRGNPGVRLSNFTFRALSVGSVGDQSAGFQGRITLVGPRASLDIEFNLYFVRVGRAIVELSAITFSIPFDQSFAQSLLEKMVGRLQSLN